MAAIPNVEFANVLAGAEGFNEGNLNETYRGQILRPGGVISNAILKDIESKELANELIALFWLEFCHCLCRIRCSLKRTSAS